MGNCIKIQSLWLNSAILRNLQSGILRKISSTIWGDFWKYKQYGISSLSDYNSLITKNPIVKYKITVLIDFFCHLCYILIHEVTRETQTWKGSLPLTITAPHSNVGFNFWSFCVLHSLWTRILRVRVLPCSHFHLRNVVWISSHQWRAIGAS